MFSISGRGEVRALLIIGWFEWTISATAKNGRSSRIAGHVRVDAIKLVLHVSLSCRIIFPRISHHLIILSSSFFPLSFFLSFFFSFFWHFYLIFWSKLNRLFDCFIINLIGNRLFDCFIMNLIGNRLFDCFIINLIGNRLFDWLMMTFKSKSKLNRLFDWLIIKLCFRSKLNWLFDCLFNKLNWIM